MRLFKHIAEVEKLETRADNTVKVILGTNELSDEDAVLLFGFRGKQCVLALAEMEIRPEDLLIDEPEPEFRNEKSPGQRLRGVLYRYWESRGKIGDFQTFYVGKMEEMIEHFKAKIDPT